MAIKHVSLEPGSMSVEDCELCGNHTLIVVIVYAMLDDGVARFGDTDRCLTCEPFGAEDAP